MKTPQRFITKGTTTLGASLLLALGLGLSTTTAHTPYVAIEQVPVSSDQDTTELNKLIQYYERTAENLKRNIEGLSEAQLQFSPGEGKWSISQCVDHIVLSEKMIFGMTKQELDKPVPAGEKEKVTQTDDEISQMITNRTQKYEAPPMLQGSGKYNTSEQAWDDFINGRKVIMDYIQQADVADLRNHVMKLPTGVADGYQNLLFIAAHTARHILQIEEVKAHPDFPKN